MALFIGLTGSTGLGCAGGPQPAPDPALRWAEQVRERVVMAQSQPSHPLRYNPAACDCPPFEIELGAVWHRVAFAGVGPGDAAVIALDDARRASPDGVWEVQGRLGSALTTCARGALVVTLTLTSFGPPALGD